ncbi:hypothetical protein T552_00712 [Pneumocystis carinii B80]|uniref:RING-type domain-containing protein n=1 Tax=Pneumocystis carinii (strain B80) TaxID=1408658 RepID=A0A0W4ZPD9_PNEC8|nr:hypothetical protein T552_00712 [Pneumocystis carinii B80]KTW30234.1 hypothetical protein T552_00712 [Pneumocystis carinii B80]
MATIVTVRVVMTTILLQLFKSWDFFISDKLVFSKLRLSENALKPAMEESEARYFCHECTNEFEEAIQCPACGSDFVEKIETSDDPRQFIRSRPRMMGWTWSFGHRPITVCSNRSTCQGTSENAISTETLSETISETTPDTSANAAPSETENTTSPPPSISAQFENMLQNILSSIVGNTATVDIALHETSDHQESQAREETNTEGGNRPRPGNFIFQRSFVWSNYPSSQEETRQSPENTTEETQETTRPRAIPVHDLESFLENAFGTGLSEEGLPVGPLGRFFSSIFSMRNPGDYVWSSTSFDNIITQLMEQYPSTNAPPPASEEVINALPRMVVEEGEDLHDCVICKEVYEPKEIYITLPCKHYFHDNCIIAWLKINNTCAICRTTVGTNVLNQPSNSETENKEDASKSPDYNDNGQLEQEPPD